MGRYDHLYDPPEKIKTCQNCGKEYIQYTTSQVPGSRDEATDNCPYCHYENDSSMSVDFHNRRKEK